MIPTSSKHNLSAEDENYLYGLVNKFGTDTPKDRIGTTRARLKLAGLSDSGIYGPHFYTAEKLAPGGSEYNFPHVVAGVCIHGLLPLRPHEWAGRIEVDQVSRARDSQRDTRAKLPHAPTHSQPFIFNNLQITHNREQASLMIGSILAYGKGRGKSFQRAQQIFLNVSEVV